MVVVVQGWMREIMAVSFSRLCLRISNQLETCSHCEHCNSAMTYRLSKMAIHGLPYLALASSFRLLVVVRRRRGMDKWNTWVYDA